MESVGSYLKDEREDRNITLEEVADATKVNINVLRAIEEGEEDKWPAQVFVQGFIRCYATYIGLDPSEALLRYKSHVSGPKNPELQPIEIPEPKKDGRSRFSKRLTWMLVSVIAVLLSLAITFYLISKPRSSGKSKFAAIVPNKAGNSIQSVPAQYLPSPQEKAVPSSTITAGESRTEKRQQTETKGPHVLQCEFRENTWIHVGIGSEAPRRYFFKKGQNFAWKTDQNIKLRIGNAGGVDLTFDGKIVKPLGKKGQVVNMTLPDPAFM